MTACAATLCPAVRISDVMNKDVLKCCFTSTETVCLLGTEKDGLTHGESIKYVTSDLHW